MDSILTSIKKLLGLTEEYTPFDTDIVIHINTAIDTLYQLGLESAKGYMVVDESNEWSEFIPVDSNLEMIKTYVYLKVRLLFDPPSSGIAEAYKETVKELEWRISNEVDYND